MDPKLELSEQNPFIVEEIPLGVFCGRTFLSEGGAVMLCTAGKAVVSVNMQEYMLEADTEIVLLTDAAFRVKEADADCRVMFFYFTREFFRSAHYNLDTLFFQYVGSHPVYRHTERTAPVVRSMFSIIKSVYEDRGNRFRTIMIVNYLRNMLLGIYDRIQHQTKQVEDGDYGRKKELFHKFMELIITNHIRHREVAWYAGQLCISRSYLAAITRGITGETPKATIDRHIVQRLKILLMFSDMSLQQIADHMNFPDQSYLGRFFKRYTGMSLAAYRSDIGSV